MIESNNCYGELRLAGDAALQLLADALRTARIGVKFRDGAYGPHLWIQENELELSTDRVADGEFLLAGIVEPTAWPRLEAVLAVFREQGVLYTIELYDAVGDQLLRKTSWPAADAG